MNESFNPRRDQHGKKKKTVEKKPFINELLSTFLYIIVITGLFVAIRTFLFAPVSVEGDSMNPTLVRKDRLVLNKVSSTDRFDIIVFPSPEDPSVQFIKRVIGVAGDTIEYRDQILYVNGKAIDEPYVDLSGESDGLIDIYNGDFSLESLRGVETVPEGSYFVLGDNRVNSKDSRSFGFIDEETVTGSTRLRIWPLDRFGFVD
ncbi:signal peptidase I [Alkalibacterium sp. MB6]|uniref:signal peptidase I n=1 Tax=Alkalibacterium sp. MB6 TaxID=2081965 RepID=UPI00137993EC|nr:signal peptidase I [Alkalibacterium sp. MB6]